MLRPQRPTLFPYTTLFRSMSLALMGDIIVAAQSAYFLQAFARIGLVPDGGSTWLLPRLVRSESTRLNSSHMSISYAVFCLKKKRTTKFATKVVILIGQVGY